MAILYNKLIVLWDVEIAHPNNDISIVCPRYSSISDLLLYLGKKTKVIMIMTTTENKAKDNETIYYEPIISKSLNKKEGKYFNLDKHVNIKNILNKCSSGATKATKATKATNANEQFYDNIENMKTIKKYIIKKSGENGAGSEFEIFRTLIINNDLSIDKIILKKNKTVLCIIKFKKISILMLDLIMKHLNIKDIAFSDDIDGETFDIYILKDVYSGIVKKFEKIDIDVDVGEITQDNGITIKSKLLFKDDGYTKNSGIISNISNKYNDFNKYSREQNKWNNMRKMVFEKLLESKYTDKYYSELLSKKSRKEVIKELLNIVKEDKNYNSRDSRELQIIIESIDVYSRQSIKNWYSNNLSYEKYNYVNDISNNIKEEGDELIFTQYLVSEKIPEKIIRDRDYSPNNYVKNTKIDFYEFKDNKDGSKSSDNIIIPENWKGAEKVLTRKWTKYKKKVWSKLRYMECNYTDKNIIDLFGFFIKYNKNKINNIITFDDIIEYTYKEYYDIITDNSADYKNEISILFKDPHFKTIYINTMNSINKTNKTFKTTKIFLDDYLYKSSVAERVNILNRIKKDESIKYYGDITLKQIATYLNINIIIIHHRVDYGKANDISKRAGSKDLKISMNFYNAGDNNNREELLKRPLIILYKKVDKSFVSYYLIKNTEDNTIIYNELNNANEDIKNIINHPDSKNKSSTPITINI